MDNAQREGGNCLSRGSMPTRAKLKKLCAKYFSWNRHIGNPAKSKGQAIVEFTLIFVLVLVIAWIPADFGLAFLTGQLAQNAARDGARIAAADPNLAAQTGTCTLPCSGQPVGSILKETAERLSSALMPGATVSVSYPVKPPDEGVTKCNDQVRVRVDGTYNFFFYRLLNLLGASVNSTVSIVRQIEKRWEHQCG